MSSNCGYKRITILVPGEMTNSWGSRENHHIETVPVDKKSILMLLSSNEYREYWYFKDPESITVESIEDVRKDI